MSAAVVAQGACWAARKLAALAAGAAVLGWLYWKIDYCKIGQAFGAADPLWLAAAFALFIPLTLLPAWRLGCLAPGAAGRLGEGVRLVLGAGAMNLLLPSRMGDLVKAHWMQRRSGLPLGSAVSLVVLERLADLAAVCTWGAAAAVLPGASSSLRLLGLGSAALGVALFACAASAQPVSRTLSLTSRLLPQRWAERVGRLRVRWQEAHADLRGDGRLVVAVLLGSLGIWLLHLVQIACFVRALGYVAPWGVHLTVNALGILAGLLPLTLAGVGTRDAALVYLYAGYLPAPAAAAVGIFGTVRYIVPGLAGLPFLPSLLRGERASPQEPTEATEPPPRSRSPS